jgi:hypothetical protein
MYLFIYEYTNLYMQTFFQCKMNHHCFQKNMYRIFHAVKNIHSGQVS